MNRWKPFWELSVCRFREFRREPEVIFWVFFFPLLLAIGLGVAFRDRPPEKTLVAVINQPGAADVVEPLNRTGNIQAEVLSSEQAHNALRLGKVAIVVVPGTPLQYEYDRTRPDSLLARSTVNAAPATGRWTTGSCSNQ